MTHPVEIDALLERYEYVPHDGAPVYVCPIASLREYGCVCGRLRDALGLKTLTAEMLDRCENLNDAVLDGWLVARSVRVERWTSQ